MVCFGVVLLTTDYSSLLLMGLAPNRTAFQDTNRIADGVAIFNSWIRP
jgi:hypothetical protein